MFDITDNIYPFINMVLLLALLALIGFGGARMLLTRGHSDASKLWDAIHALQLRLKVQESMAPCEHCRTHHGHPEDHCDECP